jgi:hypothetical protein
MNDKRLITYYLKPQNAQKISKNALKMQKNAK